MKAIPMLFQTELVRALLEGRKTVTRRPLTIEAGWELKDRKLTKITSSHPKKGKWGALVRKETFDDKYQHDIVTAPCFVGDLIYVRETWREYSNTDECGCYDHCACPPNGTPLYFATHDDGESKWKPSIHMPRKHSRLTLKVTDIRIERVRDITEDQAKSEGIAPGFTNEFGKCPVVPNYRDGFFRTWNNIYNNWDQNPYVWVIEFDVIHKNVDQVISEMEAA